MEVLLSHLIPCFLPHCPARIRHVFPEAWCGPGGITYILLFPSISFNTPSCSAAILDASFALRHSICFATSQCYFSPLSHRFHRAKLCNTRPSSSCLPSDLITTIASPSIVLLDRPVKRNARFERTLPSPKRQRGPPNLTGALPREGRRSLSFLVNN